MSRALGLALALLVLATPVGAQSGGSGTVVDSPTTFPKFSANRTLVDNAGAERVAFFLEALDANGESDMLQVTLTATGAGSLSATHVVTPSERATTTEPASFGADGFKVWTGASAVDGRLFVRHRWNVTTSVFPGAYSWQASVRTASATASTSAVEVVVTVATSIVVAAAPVDAAGASQPAASFGGWEAAPGESNVSAGNYLKITNAAGVSRARVVLDFTESAFRGPDARSSVPIHGNVQFAWWEDTTPVSTSPAEGTYAPLATSADGSTTITFSGVGNVVYVTYRIVQMPSVLRVQAYSATYTVAEIDPLPDLAGVADPGQAYEDVACDGLYHATSDLLIPNATIRAGAYDTASARCLVVPASVGALSAPSVRLASLAGVRLGVSANATSGSLLVSGGTSVVVTGASLTSAAGLDVSAGSGGATLSNVTLRSLSSYVEVRSGGPLLANQSALRPHGALVVNAAGATQLVGAALASSTGYVNLTSTGPVSAARLNVTAPQSVALASGSALVLPNATMRSSLSSLVLDAGAAINLTSASVIAGAEIAARSSGNLDVQNAMLGGAGGAGLRFDLRAAGRTFFMQGASFSDANRRAEVSPAGVVVAGSPASGTIRVL